MNKQPAENKPFSFEQYLKDKNELAMKRSYEFYSNPKNKIEPGKEKMVSSLLDIIGKYFNGEGTGILLDRDVVTYSISSSYLEEQVSKPKYKGRTLDEILSVLPPDYVISGIEEQQSISKTAMVDEILLFKFYCLYLFVTGSDVPLSDGKDYDLIFSIFEKELSKQKYGGYSFQEYAHLDEPPFLTEIISEICSKATNIPRAAAKKTDKIDYPVDKVNNTVWRLLEKDTQNQLTLSAENSKSKKQLNLIYSIDFASVEQSVAISKRLTAFDKRAYIAVASLYNAGNSIVSLTQIYRAMGYLSDPNPNHLKALNESLTKMLGAIIHLDNTQEAAAYKYVKYEYDGALLPMERMTAIINGQIADAAVHIFREPPLISFAKGRKQVTTIDLKLLQSPLSKTEGNLSLDDYLIERISRAKAGTQPKKLLLRTIYEKAGITTDKQRQRAPEKIKRYLNYYKDCGLITGYKETEDSFIVSFED